MDKKKAFVYPPPPCAPQERRCLFCTAVKPRNLWLNQPPAERMARGFVYTFFFTPAFDPRDIVFLFPAKTWFGGFVTPDVVGAALLTPIPPRPPSPALSCLHSKPQHPARHGLVRAFPKQTGPQGDSNLSAFARWRRSISLLSPFRGDTEWSP